MSARKTTLHMSAYSLDGTSLIGYLKAFNVDINASLQDSRGANEAFPHMCTTKKAAMHRFEIVEPNGGACNTNLNVTVYTEDGDNMLGNLKGGTISAKNNHNSGAGIADTWKFPNALSRDWNISTRRFIPFATLLDEMMDDFVTGAISAVDVVVALTIGVNAYSAPMTLESLAHEANTGDFQFMSGVFKNRGAPTSPTGSASLIATAFAGDALISLAADTEAGQWSGTGIIESLDVKFEDEQLIMNSGVIAIQGAPTYVTSV